MINKQIVNNLLGPKTVKTALFTFLLAVIFYIFLSLYSGPEKITIVFSRFPTVKFLPIILLTVILGWFLRGLRWHYYLRQLDIKRISLWESLHIFFASFAFTVTPGKAGELIKGFFLKDNYNVSFFKTAGILFMERLMDLAAVLVLSASLIFVNKQHLWLFFACLIIVAFCFILLCFENIYKPLLVWLLKFRFLNWISRKILEILETSKTLLSPQKVLVSMMFSVLAWGLEAAAFYFVLAGFGFTAISFYWAVFIYALSTIAGALSMLPGGIVSTEATMFALLALQNISVSMSVPAVLLFRFCTLWFIPLLGVFFMIFLLKKY